MGLFLSVVIVSQMLDSLNMRTVGCWPFSRGNAAGGAVVCPVSDSILYVGAGRGMYVLDISNPSSVTKLDSFIKPGGAEGDWAWFSVSDDYALSGQFKSGVALYDIRDKRRPVLVSTYLTPDFSGRSQLIGRYGFIACNGLRILDYTDPDNPVEIGNYETPDAAYSVFVKDNYAYLANCLGGFRIIDISDLRNPVEVFHHEIPGYSAYHIWVMDTVAYIAWGTKGLRIWNVSNPLAPSEIATYSDYIYFVTVVDTIAYALRPGVTAPYVDYLHVLNVADPSHPRLLTRYRANSATISSSRGFLINGEYEDTLTILDISEPIQPIVLDTFSQFHALTDGLFPLGNYAYAATRGQGMKIYDVSDPRAPRLLSWLGSWLVNQIFVTPDRIAYLACWKGPMFRVVDVSDPHNPVLLSTIDSLGYAHGITVRDSLAFLSNGYNVWVVNVADPRAPRRIGVIPSRNAIPWHCAVDGNLLFVPYTYGDVCLKIYDISDPTRPESLSCYYSGGALSDVAVRFPYAYVVGGVFVVLDVSNPREPREVAVRSVPDYAWSIALDGNLAYVAESYWGVRVYDVSDPTNPTETGFYITPGFANQVELKDGLAYVADSDGWLVLEHYSGGVAESGSRLPTGGRVYVFYHPASQTLRVKLLGLKERLRSLEVFNTSGIKVYSMAGESLNKRPEVFIGPLALAPGVYFLTISSPRNAYTTKFIVVR